VEFRFDAAAVASNVLNANLGDYSNKLNTL